MVKIILKMFLSAIFSVLFSNESISNEPDGFNLGQSVLTQQQAYTQGYKEESQIPLEEEPSPTYVFPEGEENYTCSDGFAHCLGKMMCVYQITDEKNHECYCSYCHPMFIGIPGLFYGVGFFVSSVAACTGDAVAGYIAAGFASSLACIPLVHFPYICLSGAEWMGKKRFVKNFREGQRCLPTHRCSFHSLSVCCNSCCNSCWEPCCGPND